MVSYTIGELLIQYSHCLTTRGPWPTLRVVDISICAEFDLKHSGTFLFNKFLPGTMI